MLLSPESQQVILNRFLELQNDPDNLGAQASNLENQIHVEVTSTDIIPNTGDKVRAA